MWLQVAKQRTGIDQFLWFQISHTPVSQSIRSPILSLSLYLIPFASIGGAALLLSVENRIYRFPIVNTRTVTP